MKKRLFLALTAFSLSLAGCGTDPKDKKPEEQKEEKDPTPKDPLTPEQRQNATEFNTLLTTVLNIAKADSTGSEEYVLKYAEELAAADYKSADLQSLIIVAMQTLNISDPSKITADDVFGLLETCESMSLLDDAIYFAVAFAKSYGRAYANSNEEAG